MSRPSPSVAPSGGHPIPAEFLLDYAAGTAPEPIAVLVATHVALNRASRDTLRELEAAGGALLASVDPVAVSVGSLARVLARLGPQDATPDQEPPPQADAEIPAPLQAYVPHGLASLRWRRVLGFAATTLPCREASPYTLSLLRVAASRAFPMHGHGGLELLLVLKGGFSDEKGHYLRGDVCAADETTEHRPVADSGGECLCLAVTCGPVRFKGALGVLLAPFLRG